MDFEVAKRPKLKVKIYDNEFNMVKPTIRQAEGMRKKLKAMAEGDELKVMGEFLQELGLPSSIMEEMELEHFTSLTEWLLGVKKN